MEEENKTAITSASIPQSTNLCPTTSDLRTVNIFIRNINKRNISLNESTSSALSRQAPQSRITQAPAHGKEPFPSRLEGD